MAPFASRTVAALLASACASGASAFGRYGAMGSPQWFPGHGYHDDYLSGWRGDWGDGNYYPSRRPSPPCPQYLPMSVSDWSQAPSGNLHLRASLPGAPASQRRVWLSDDGSTLHIRAVRPVPARGAACLPRSARLSADGRYEIFEASVAVPSFADASRAALREVREGLHISLPLSLAAVRAAPVELPRARRPRAGAKGADEAERPPAALVEALRRVPAATTAPAPAPVLTPEQLRLIEGLEVVEEDYPWPEKAADAAEGWWDNRGEFQFY